MIERVTCNFGSNAVSRNQSDGLDLSCAGLLDVVGGPDASSSSGGIIEHLLHAGVSKEVLHLLKVAQKYDTINCFFYFYNILFRENSVGEFFHPFI